MFAPNQFIEYDNMLLHNQIITQERCAFNSPPNESFNDLFIFIFTNSTKTRCFGFVLIIIIRLILIRTVMVNSFTETIQVYDNDNV